MRVSLSMFFLLLLSTISYSQQYFTNADTLNCLGGTTTFIVDLSANADTTWTSPPQTRDGDCCGTDNNCVQFALTLAPGSVGINFFIPGGCGAEPSGALYYQVDCGPLTSVGQPLCLDGTGPFILTFCKPGNNANCYSIQSIPSPSSSGDVVTADGCTDTLSVSGLNPSSITWTSISPGATGAYNGLLSDLSGSINGANGIPFTGFETVVVTPGLGSPPTIEYVVCGDVVGFCIMEPWCDTVSVSIYPTLFANIQPDPAVICAGGLAETLTANPIGGTAPYYYLWSTPVDPLLNGDTTQTIDVTIPGEYSVMISDVTGCPYGFDTVVVSEYSNNITVDAGPDITICGDPLPTMTLNGSSPITGSGVWTNYSGTFNILDTNLILNYTPSAVEIAAGFAELVLMSTYNYSCPGDADTVIIYLTEFTADLTLTQTDLSCVGTNDGTIDLTITGSPAPFTYSWSNGSGSEDISGLSPILYEVYVTDGNGCVDSIETTIIEPAVLEIIDTIYSNYSGFNISCFGFNDGSIDITPFGGTSPYSFSWSTTNGGGIIVSDEDQTGLSFGTYNVIVTDANGCQIAQSYTLSQPTPLTEAIEAYSFPSGDNISCPGASDGSIDLTNTGGIPGYTYAWTTLDGSGLNPSNQNQSGLTVGTYEVTVTDQNGCQIMSIITLIEPIPLTESTTAFVYPSGDNISCFGFNDGSIDLTNTGGVAPYTYAWSTSDGSGLVATAQDQSGLTAGTYNVTTTDVNGCTITSSITLIEPIALTESTAGLNTSCFGSNDGSIDLSITNGSPGYTFAWSTANGSGLSPTTEDQSGLIAGTYNVTTTDANGCTIASSITLVEPTPLDITLIPSVYAGGYNLSGCINDGTIDLQISGGTPGYNFSWTTSNGSGLIVTDEDQSGLSVGTYDVTAIDQNGCTITSSITLTDPASLTDSLTAFIYPSGDNISCFGFNDGSINLTNTGGVPPYSYSWSTTDGSGLNVTNEDQSGLTAGTYSVTTTDANGCTITSSITLGEPIPLIDSISSFMYPSGDNISCFGFNDGSIDLTNTGGSPGYSYSWTTSDGSGLSPTSEDQSNLTAGTYTVTTTDINGCIITSIITLVEPTAIDITLTPSIYAGGYNLSGCLNDGTIDLQLSGGSPAYDFMWSTSNGSGLIITDEDQSGLSTGTYDITATDQNGCTISGSITLIEPASLTDSLTAFVYPSGDNISCIGANDGSIDLTITGGTPPYSYSWSTTDGSGLNVTNEDQSGLTIGTYDVTTTDANGCTISSSITLVEPTPFIQDITSALYPGGENISCFSFSDGSINYSVSGSSPGYTYSWSNGAVTEDVSGLSVGTYTVTVTDLNGCTTDTMITLSEPTSLTESITAYVYPGGQNISCFGFNDGSIDLLISDGSPSYSYSWNTSNGSGLVVNDEDQSGLTAGTYNVTVTDTNGCLITSSITLTEPAPLSSTTSITSDYNGQAITCQGATDGGVTIEIVGGSPSYTYEWFDEQGTLISTDMSPTGLGAGTYDVIATDLNGCTVADSIVILNPPTYNVDLSVSTNYNGQAISCFGASDGGIDMTVLGGTPGYTYLWSDANGVPVGITEDITGLPAGEYHITIVDANGCQSDTVITLDQPTEVDGVATITSDYNGQNISCFQASDGMITVDPTGGTPNYTYEWINAAGSFMGNVQNAGNLIAGTYTVEITDANGCTYYTNIQLTEPSQVVATIDILSDYFGFPISCSGQSDGVIQASGAGGTPGYTYEWDTNPIQTDSVISNLGEGIYTVTITDINGCIGTQTLELEGNPLPVINPNPATEVCYGEMVTFNSNSNQEDACVWTFSNGMVVDNCGPNTVLFEDVGCYDASLIVTGPIGCIDSVFLTDYICVNSNPIADFSASTYDPTILDNSVSFFNESFNATNYQWDFADGSFSFQEDVTHNFPSNNPGEYFVVLYAYNESNCVDSIGKLVKVWDKLFFYVPNTFTPDNDELNQVFIPLFGSGYSFENYEFSIFNRWGERIFETTDIYKGWDGMYRGDLSQDGTYTWKIILRASEDAMEEEQKNIYHGHVNLIR